jgi:cell division protein FtsZ
MLADATHVLVQIAGGPGMTLSEVEILMQELGRNVSDQTQILFGAVVDSRLGDRLGVTIISSLSAEDEAGLLQTPSAPSNVSTSLPARDHYEPATSQPEFQPEEPVAEPAPVEETVAFDGPTAAEALPAATPMSTETPLIPTRNGEPEHLITKPAEKSASWKEEKAFAEKPASSAKQEVLQFEPVTRGRFEKSEPTIIEGEDLDVPTYLRKNVKVK